MGGPEGGVGEVVAGDGDGFVEEVAVFFDWVGVRAEKSSIIVPVEQNEQVPLSSMPSADGQKSNEAAPPEGEKSSRNALKKAAKEKGKGGERGGRDLV